jgi:hypothetical protein
MQNDKKQQLIKLTKLNNESIIIGVNQIISIESYTNKDGLTFSIIKCVGAMVYKYEVKESIEEIYSLYIN